MKYIIVTGTVTHAIRGRDILRKNGFEASVERNSKGLGRFGCGYGIVIKKGNISEATEILNSHSVKILDVSKI